MQKLTSFCSSSTQAWHKIRKRLKFLLMLHVIVFILFNPIESDAVLFSIHNGQTTL